MLADVVQNFELYTHTDSVKYVVAAVGLCGFVGLYYIGEYLFSERRPEPDLSAE
ncbi:MULTISPECIES: hypothetical protein [Bradyrhizobium]|uniref:hypothetical protein n=1 Tax=Bradyrhizobium TaxID=374 RepID=UPI0003FED8B7|nr:MULTISPECIES: hypothetical protein [Bradyrhizobium]UFW47065.1 hypothetical protein BaraCB756_32985 [Bradyrhizobium arachidis]